jgi:hypothetical protein
MGNPVVMEIPWEFGNLLFEAIRMVMVWPWNGDEWRTLIPIFLEETKHRMLIILDKGQEQCWLQAVNVHNKIIPCIPTIPSHGSCENLLGSPPSNYIKGIYIYVSYKYIHTCLFNIHIGIKAPVI